MNTGRAALIGLVAIVASWPCRAEDHASHGVSAAALLYMDFSQWRRTDDADKIALAQDAMRVFCGDPAMPPRQLVTCLDREPDNPSLTESALACIANGRIAESSPGR